MNNPMDVWIRTRSFDTDYSFLGSAPTDLWWLEYDRSIDPSRPGAALESAGNAWKIYLTGISSSRSDSAHRRIRYTLVLGGTAGDQPAMQNASAILRNWLQTAVDNEPMSALPALLDEQFDEPTVASLLERRNADAAAEVTRRLREAFGKLRDVTAADSRQAEPASRADPSWIGDLHADQPREEWLACTATLLSGSPGRALVVNLLQSEADLDDQPSLRVPESGALAILLAQPDPSLGARIRIRARRLPRPEVTHPKVPLMARLRCEWSALPPGRKRISILVLIGLVLGAIAAIIRWLT